MPTKYGKIITFGRDGGWFVEAYLEAGERVEIPHQLLRYISERYSRDTCLVFVERRGRLFHFVQWVGTPDEAVEAERTGVLKSREVPWGVRMIGQELARLGEVIKTKQQQRQRLALGQIAQLLPNDCRASLADFAAFIDQLTRLREPQLALIRADYDRMLEGRAFTETFSQLSGAAINVGWAVRWVRWPGPSDANEQELFRTSMDHAGFATEVAASALSEPRLERSQVSLLYGPFAQIIPLSAIGITL